jgi:hypothetical protein
MDGLLGMDTVQAGVHTGFSQQLRVTSLLDDPPLLQHQDLIGSFNGGQTMRNQ